MLVEIKAEIDGVTPLIMNRFIDKAKTGVSGADKGTPSEQAEAKLYRGLNGNIMLPAPNLFRCIIDAGTFFKVGKSKVTTQKSSLVPACVDLRGVELAFSHKENWRVHESPVVIPSTGGRIMCYRPTFDDWHVRFELELDTDFIPLKMFREIVDAAGKRIGLGDFRPSRKGLYGKFAVAKWKTEEMKPAKAA